MLLFFRPDSLLSELADSSTCRRNEDLDVELAEARGWGPDLIHQGHLAVAQPQNAVCLLVVDLSGLLGLAPEHNVDPPIAQVQLVRYEQSRAAALFRCSIQASDQRATHMAKPIVSDKICVCRSACHPGQLLSPCMPCRMRADPDNAPPFPPGGVDPLVL